MVSKSIYTLAFLCVVSAGRQTLPNSFPNAWPGQPVGDYSPEWQSYFEVIGLPPAIPTGLPRSFAGNINVNRTGHKNDTLFFWGFEREGASGTLTAAADASNTDPWVLWLQGGPGSSGLLGMATENGPIHVLSDGSWVLNPYSWHTLADTIWIDQPVGTGFSTASSTGYAADEEQVAEDFFGFLTNLVKVFPALATRPLYLMGESYAGAMIPYIVKRLFASPSGPVTLGKVVIGNPALGSVATIRDLPVVNMLQTYPEIIGYDQDVFNYFKEQHHLCGYDLNLTYPQIEPFPTLNFTSGLKAALNRAAAHASRRSARTWKDTFLNELAARQRISERSVSADRSVRRSERKRDISGPTGTIDFWYGCDIFDEMTDYALNFTAPWTTGNFDTFDIPDATHPEPVLDPSTVLNDPLTRAALHAPTSKDWSSTFDYPWGSVSGRFDPSVEPIAFLSELAANASARNIPFVFYSGNDDARISHRGTETLIQNFTFGGVQGFTRKPSTPWFDDDGNVAGIVHQERNVTYILVAGAGHEVPQWKPAQSLVFLREFVFGANRNGTVEGSTVVGIEDASLAADYFPGGGEIFFGSRTTSGTFTFPSATVAAWNSFMGVTPPTGTAPGLVPATASPKANSARASRWSTPVMFLVTGMVAVVSLLC
ncbi:alpha/beta-hydrolase [Trametes versicolor FP-101664 SS1]|uniref:alpha/beta-hydrolase n=1 Tax=Trametes versicolor (strain FP-101664) TaxID=717944 RepID=UPI0004621A96|nr:alpha/beta-hydrolase [Trametes versicolor FP-101664 SS1]EIW53484.1 alpha/beta-hydrolase [Trametes versicolor FP-101664 SS1]